jgi:hypothetical protein
MAKHNSNTIIKFSDDTKVVGLNTDNDETAYREEVRDNLSLNMIVDYRKRRAEHTRILITWAVVEQVQSFRFLSTSPTN